MGRLYLATDPVIGRQLAIKLIRNEIEDPEVRARFTQEARAAGAIKHPNVVTVFDAGDHEGHPFIAMEYVEGEMLSTIIKERRPLPLPAKLYLTEQLCRGLACAHRAGLVHRDIKPANLMVDAEGTLKILDFGIARVAESGLTSAGVAIGTMNYMSPEQVTGRTVDHRSDVFSVGAVFQELLSHEPAFPGSPQDGVMYRIVHGEPTSLSERCPDLPTPIVEMVSRALRTDPATRYQDLDTMADELVVLRQQLDEDDARPLTPAHELETIMTPSSGRAGWRPPASGPSARPSAGRGASSTLTARRESDSSLAPTSTTDVEEPAAPGRSWGLWAAGAAVLAAVVVAGVALMPWSGAVDETPGVTPASTSAQPDPPAASGGANTAPEGEPEAATEPPPVSEGADAATAPVETPAPEPIDLAPPPPLSPEPNEVAAPLASPATDRDGAAVLAGHERLRQEATDALDAGDREGALTAVASVLRLVPDDARAVTVLDQLQGEAELEASQSRAAVAPRARRSPRFQEATRAQSRAGALFDDGQREAGIRQLWRAQSLFDGIPDTPPGARGGRPPVAGTRDEAPPATTPTPPSADPPPAVPAGGAARAAVRATLDRYRAAYEQLDAAALRAVYPSVPEDAVSALATFETYALSLDDLVIEIAGVSATAVAELSLSVQPRNGTAARASGSARFQLERSGPAEWMIRSIDMTGVR